MKTMLALICLVLFCAGCSQGTGTKNGSGNEILPTNPLPPSENRAEGTVNGGGGGDLAEQTNPWFLGEEPIEYCIHVEPGFSIAVDQVRSTIRSAFKEWERTLNQYGYQGQPLEGRFADGIERGIAIKTIEVPNCTNPDQQLEFKIGVVDEEVNEHFKHNTKRILGFTERKLYDHKRFRNGGYVWVAPQNWIGPLPHPVPNPTHDTIPVFPDWTKKSWFKAMLVHEIGHVFGFPHVRGTVMDEDIFDLLLWEHAYCIEEKNCFGTDTREVDGTVEPGKVQFNPFQSRQSTPIPLNVGHFLLKASGIAANLMAIKGTVTFSEKGSERFVKWTVISGDKSLEFEAPITALDEGNGVRSTWLFYSPNFKSDLYKGSDENREPLLFMEAYGRVYVGSIEINGRRIPFSISLDKNQSTLFMNPDGSWTDGVRN